MEQAVVPDEATSPQLAFNLSDGDISLHSVSSASSPYSRDSSKLLDRSTDLLDQIRARRAARDELTSPPSKMTTHADSRLLRGTNSSPVINDDNPDDENATGSWKPYVMNEPVISKPLYHPSESLERVRELMRGRQTTRAAETEKTTTPLPSRSSRVKLLYGSRTESDAGRFSGSRLDRMKGASLDSMQMRTRYDDVETGDVAIVSRRESLLADLAKKRESILSSSKPLERADFRLDKKDYMRDSYSVTNGTYEKKDGDIVGQGMENFRYSAKSGGSASISGENAVNGHNKHMKSLDVDRERLNTINETHTFSERSSFVDTNNGNRSGFSEGTDAGCLINDKDETHSVEDKDDASLFQGQDKNTYLFKGKDEASPVEDKNDACLVKGDISDNSESDEAIETSEELMFVVQENGRVIYHTIPDEKNNNTSVGQDQFKDMPELEEDSSWDTNLKSEKTAENLVERPFLSKKYSFDENALSPGSSTSNTKSLENSEFWIKLEKEKSKLSHEFVKNPYLSEFPVGDTVSSMEREFNVDKHDEFDEASVLKRMEQIKHDLQCRREIEKESDLMYSSFISKEQSTSPETKLMNNWVDSRVTYKKTVDEDGGTKTFSGSGVKLVTNGVQLRNDDVDNFESQEYSPKSKVHEEIILKKSGSTDGECVEFVKNVSNLPVVVFTHPMNGDALGGDAFRSVTVPEQKVSPGHDVKSKPATPKNRTLYKEPLKLQEVVIVPKLKVIQIPEPFKGDDINENGKVAPNSPIKQVVSKEAKPIIATKPVIEKRGVDKISSQKSVEGTDFKSVAKAKEPDVNKITAQKSLDYKHAVDRKPDNQVKESLSRKVSPPLSNNSVDAESEVDAPGTPKLKTKKFKRPSVKAAIRKWEQKKNKTDPKCKSTTELNQETETTKSFFDRLSQPKSPYEGPPLVRQLSGRRRSSVKQSNSGTGNGVDSLSSLRRRSTPDLSPSNLVPSPTNSDNDSETSSRSVYSVTSSSSSYGKSKELPGYMRPVKRQQRSTQEYLYGSPTSDKQKGTPGQRGTPDQRNTLRNGLSSHSPDSSVSSFERKRSKSASSKRSDRNLVNGMSTGTKLLVTQLLVMDFIGAVSDDSQKEASLLVDHDTNFVIVKGIQAESDDEVTAWRYLNKYVKLV